MGSTQSANQPTSNDNRIHVQPNKNVKKSNLCFTDILSGEYGRIDLDYRHIQIFVGSKSGSVDEYPNRCASGNFLITSTEVTHSLLYCDQMKKVVMIVNKLKDSIASDTRINSTQRSAVTTTLDDLAHVIGIDVEKLEKEKKMDFLADDINGHGFKFEEFAPDVQAMLQQYHGDKCMTSHYRIEFCVNSNEEKQVAKFLDNINTNHTAIYYGILMSMLTPKTQQKIFIARPTL